MVRSKRHIDQIQEPVASPSYEGLFGTVQDTPDKLLYYPLVHEQLQLSCTEFYRNISLYQRKSFTLLKVQASTFLQPHYICYEKMQLESLSKDQEGLLTEGMSADNQLSTFIVVQDRAICDILGELKKMEPLLNVEAQVDRYIAHCFSLIEKSIGDMKNEQEKLKFEAEAKDRVWKSSMKLKDILIAIKDRTPVKPLPPSLLNRIVNIKIEPGTETPGDKGGVESMDQEMTEITEDMEQGFVEETEDMEQGFVEETEEMEQGFVEETEEMEQGFIEETGDMEQGVIEETGEGGQTDQGFTEQIGIQQAAPAVIVKTEPMDQEITMNQEISVKTEQNDQQMTADTEPLQDSIPLAQEITVKQEANAPEWTGQQQIGPVIKIKQEPSFDN